MIALIQQKDLLRARLAGRKTELLLACYVPLYLVIFFLVEAAVPQTEYWVSYLPIDDRIPFWPPAVLGYLLWFPFLLGTGLWLFCREPRAFRRMMRFMIVSFTSISIFYVLWPNGQDLRPASLGEPGVFPRLVGLVYSIDTNTNVFPSLHVVGCCMATNAYFDAPSLRPLRGWAVFASLLICCSTVLVKQHSVLDLIGGVCFCVPLTLVVYHRRLGFGPAAKKG